jgi:hypothetical protein
VSEGRHHKHQRRLDEDETKSHVIGSRYRADQWASFKVTHNPTDSVHAMNIPNLVKNVTVQPKRNRFAPTVVLAPDTTDDPTACNAAFARSALRPAGVRTYAPAMWRM